MKHAMEIFDLLLAVRKGVKPAAAVRPELDSKVDRAQTEMQGGRLDRFAVFAEGADAFLRLCELQQGIMSYPLSGMHPIKPDFSGLDLWLACLQTRAERV